MTTAKRKRDREHEGSFNLGWNDAMNKTVSAQLMAADEWYQKGFQAYLDESRELR